MTQQNTNPSALALREDYSQALATAFSQEAEKTMRAIMSPGEQVSFSVLERIKVPTGGALNWELPDGSAGRVYTGVILHRQVVRAYWRTAFDGGKNPPDCSSIDGVEGEGDPGGACEHCPMNKWGSSIGEKGEERRGKACRQLTRLFFITPESALPVLLTLPPSSYQEGQNYALRLAAKRIPYWGVVTAARLINDQSEGGIKYSKVQLASEGLLSPETVKRVEEIRAALVPVLTAPPDIDDAE